MSDAGAAILWIAADEGSAAVRGLSLLGLPLLRRNILAAERAGFSRILVEEGPRELLDGTRAEAVPQESPIPELPPARLVIVSGRLLVQPGALAKLRGAPEMGARVAVDRGRAVVLDSKNPAAVLERVRGRRSVDELFAAAAGPVGAAPWPPGGDRGAIELSGPADRGRAERWLLDGLVKENEGFMSRHVERRISLAISRRLASTPVTPNAMTAVSVAVGLAGAPFFFSTRPVHEFTGALLFLAHSILDGCDGELARLKFQESRLGGLLDFWGDNLVHCAVFAAIAIGWSRDVGEAWPLGLGAAAVLGTLLSAGLVFRETMTQEREGPLFTTVSRAPESRFSRAADALARRDFIYLAVLLSAFGKANWFLALAAAGAPLFFLVLVALAAAAERRSPDYS